MLLAALREAEAALGRLETPIEPSSLSDLTGQDSFGIESVR